jgi:hypothetical protein
MLLTLARDGVRLNPQRPSSIRQPARRPASLAAMAMLDRIEPRPEPGQELRPATGYLRCPVSDAEPVDA